MTKPEYPVKAKCKQCGATLFFAKSADVEIRCPRCKTVNAINIQGTNEKHTVNRE